jgi:hypothetical protein
VEHDGQSGKRHHFPVSEGYDRAAVDAYLRKLATEVQTLKQASGVLHERLQALGGELQTLAASLEASLHAGLDERPAPVPGLSASTVAHAPPDPPPPAAPPDDDTTPAAGAAEASARPADDLDGARLVALNMALSGEPREQTDRYLADSFQLADRAKLLDEVYAAVGS